MPFVSINPTNPKTNQWNFHKIFLRIGDFEKRPFWETAILEFFCLIPMKISHKSYDRMDGTNIWCFPWFPQPCVILCYTVYFVSTIFEIGCFFNLGMYALRFLRSNVIEQLELKFRNIQVRQGYLVKWP